ncbi:hypothetical protein EQH57_0210, partial [Dictyocoela roeselum]
GIIIMEKTLRRYVKMRGMKRYLKKVCGECIVCSTEKDKSRRYGIPVYNHDVTDKDQTIAVDLKGPIKSTIYKTFDHEGDLYVLVVVDVFTRFSEIALLSSIDSKTVCEELTKIWLSNHPVPKKCLTDNGRQVTSTKFERLLTKFKIKHVKTAPYNPTGNSIVERINKEVGNVLRISREKTIEELKRNIWIRLNCTVNKSTGYAPYELYYGKSIFGNLDIDIIVNLENLREKAKKQRAKYTNRLKKTRSPVQYKRGDRVFIRNHSSDKTAPKWLGPYPITKISTSGNNLTVETENKKMRMSINNCYPAEEGEDVVAREAPTENKKGQNVLEQVSDRLRNNDGCQTGGGKQTS